MGRRTSLALLLFVGILAQYAVAETMGERSALDSRVQTAIFNPDNVYLVQAKIGRTSSIKLPANETVMGKDGVITSGDPAAWEMGLNQIGNLITLKPINPSDPNTNFTINTNRNTYLLELKLVSKLSDMTYLLRFKHPDRPKPVPFNLATDPCSGLRSGPYKKRGERSLAPAEAWDNGTFTCFRFPTNLPRPVVYQVLPDGTETLANVRPVQDILVVHGVSHLFRFRMNSLVLEIAPTQALQVPYNFNGTTTGEVREVKRAGQ